MGGYRALRIVEEAAAGGRWLVGQDLVEALNVLLRERDELLRRNARLFDDRQEVDRANLGLNDQLLVLRDRLKAAEQELSHARFIIDSVRHALEGHP